MSERLHTKAVSAQAFIPAQTNLLQRRRPTLSNSPPLLLQRRPMQAKLTINKPSDIYEQEADRVAQQMVSSTPLQHKCKASCPSEDEKKKVVQRKNNDVSTGASVSNDLIRNLGPGQPLNPAMRAFFEPRFGHDFSKVRVHTDVQAAESARAVNARAFTAGRDVVFGKGEYAPGTGEGRMLLAHELTHVVQQRNTIQRQAQQPQAPPAAQQPTPRQLAIACQNQQVTPQQTGGNNSSAITITGAASNANLQFTVQAQQSSGHSHPAQNRPVGNILPAQVVANQNGEASANFTSGIVAGTERITVRQQGQPAQEAHCDIDVHVQALALLGAGQGYQVVGATATHPHNHYALPATNIALQRIATEFSSIPNQANPIIQQRINALQQQAPQQPAPQLTNQQMATILANPAAPNLQGLSVDQLQQLQAALNNWPILGYNDLSLVHGGIFDINGTWAPPHITHRIGNTLDLRNSNLNAFHQLIIRPIITRNGANILNEGNHWHLTF